MWNLHVLQECVSDSDSTNNMYVRILSFMKITDKIWFQLVRIYFNLIQKPFWILRKYEWSLAFLFDDFPTNFWGLNHRVFVCEKKNWKDESRILEISAFFAGRTVCAGTRDQQASRVPRLGKNGSDPDKTKASDEDKWTLKLEDDL